MSIRYKKVNYKFVLEDNIMTTTDMLVTRDVRVPYISLYTDGTLFVDQGYAWDGASKPAINTKSFIRGSLFHDTLYQLMRMERLDIKFRKASDALLRKICLEDGMFKTRANLDYWGVRMFAKGAPMPRNVKQVLTAP